MLGVCLDEISLDYKSATLIIVPTGCDRKILVTADPTRPQMDAYMTGAPSYAIEPTESENVFYAGLRSGRVLSFDQREPRVAAKKQPVSRAAIVGQY
jgi:hypothetical protein